MGIACQEKMTMAGDSMMKAKAKTTGIMREVMAHQMVDGQHKMMMKK